MIELKNVTLGYGRKKIVTGLNHQFYRDQMNFIIGLNGSGKSTLLKTLLKMTPLLGGEINLDGTPLTKINQTQMAQKIAAVLPMNFSLPEIRTEDFLSLYKKIENSKIEESLSQFNLLELKKEFITKLSQGQLQQLFIIRALLQDTPYIILDEPTAHLDYKNKPKIFQKLKFMQEKHQKGIIIITHELEYAENLADNKLIL